MGRIKRMLWIEDNQDITRARRLFPDAETKKVATMDEAIREISGTHLYDYDTVVLDIDFENGLPNGPEFVVDELTKKIYLSKDQQNKKFLMDNGGYLLYIYLLEKGYPSEQIAFFTGNGGIIEGLKRYTQESINQFSKDEIAALIIKTWEETWNGDDDSIDIFLDAVEKLPIRSEFKVDSIDYAASLYDEDEDELKRLVEAVRIEAATESIQNTGDMMIYRFHEANLEAPVYFSKNDNDIEDHNFIDAEKWLLNQRTENRMTRWLTLEATDYIEQLFQENGAMDRQVASLFNRTRQDPGIRSAFRQMFFVFDGLRATERRGAYYQALSAMLVPFDSIPKNRRPIIEKQTDYENMRWTFAWFAKEARNYSAHNLLGSSVSNNTLLFILTGTLISVLSREQLDSLQYWVEIYKREFYGERRIAFDESLFSKVDQTVNKLLDSGHISLDNEKIKGLPNGLINQNEPIKSKPYGIVKILGLNSKMTTRREPSSAKREEYYVFCLAAYIVKSFEGMDISAVNRSFGDAVSSFLEMASIIVEEYKYPYGDE